MLSKTQSLQLQSVHLLDSLATNSRPATMNNVALLKSKYMLQIPLSLTSPLHSHDAHHSNFSIQLPKHKLLSFHIKIPSGLLVFASKFPSKGDIFIRGTEEFDFQDEIDDEFDEEVEERDEEIIVPLRNMRQWTRNKPRGFGEGKVYDTSIEDKIMKELEQGSAAELINVNNLKNNPEDGNPNIMKGKLPKQKVPKVVPDGVCVRLFNLPKKKNINRDLQAAFKSFSGITNIIPAVSGNEKTREPVCKGFAFVVFRSEKEAKRFVDTFSMQQVTFGKVQKQIKCEMMKLSSPNPTSINPPIDSLCKTETPPSVSNPRMAGNLNPATETPFDLYVENAGFDKFKNAGDDIVPATDDYNNENVGYSDNMVRAKEEPETISKQSKKQKKIKENGKKIKVAMAKAEKVNIPGSANRLKLKEKALLSGVFSRYGGKPTMSSKGTEVTGQVR